MRKQLVNLLCAGNKVFVKYQVQGGVYPIPLRTPLIISDKVNYRGTQS